MCFSGEQVTVLEKRGAYLGRQLRESVPDESVVGICVTIHSHL